MVNQPTAPHGDGTLTYAPADEATNNAWRLHGLASAIKSLAAGKRLTPHQHAALDGIISEAERLA